MNGEAPKYDDVRTYMHQASALTRELRHDLNTTTAMLDKSNAEIHRLQAQNRQLVIKRTDRGLLESMEAVAGDLHEQIHVRDIKLRTKMRDYEKLQKELDSVNAEKVTLQSENNLLKQRVQTLEIEHVVLKSQYDSLVTANDAFIKSESVCRANIHIETDSLKADKLVLEAKNKSLALENLNLNTERKKLLREINLANLRYCNLTEVQKTTNGVVWDQRTELQALKARVQVLEKEHFETFLEENELPGVVCPITHEVMTDPVVAADGFTYDKAGLDGWIGKARNKDLLTSPMTRNVMGAVYIPNIALKQLLEGLQNIHTRVVDNKVSLVVGGEKPRS
jgi:chromosome segregation ATPase